MPLLIFTYSWWPESSASPANFSARKSTSARTRAGTINAANLLRAHALVESGRAMGKVVLQGF
jgi:hypothetical protein